MCNTLVLPYCSSIGTHIRRFLDFYECIFIINSEDKIDLTVGLRNIDLEKKCNCTKDYLDLAIGKLKILDFDVTDTVSIVDDFGLGDIEIPNTYGSLLAQANSHTIRHYAIINYIFDSLGIVINDAEYG